jgi:hypothetical protein
MGTDHAYVVPVEQDLWQLDLRAGKVAGLNQS